MIAPDLEHTARLLNARVRSEFRRISVDSNDCCGAQPLRRETREPYVQKVRAPLNASRRERLLPPLRRSVMRYVLRVSALASGRFFTVELDRETAVVTLNSDHPFHESVYMRALEASLQERFRLECLILAAARAELASRGLHWSADEYVEAWSDALAAFLKAH